MLILKFVLKFIRILNKDASPQQIAGGIALGSIIGITPLTSLHNLVVLVLILMVRVNISSALLGVLVFTAFAYVLDPLFNSVGYYLLVDAAFLQPLWTVLYNMPVVPWTKFNNTLTLGSLACALLVFWPLYFLLVWAVVNYRERLMAGTQKWKIVTMLKSSKLYNMYSSYS